MKAYFVSTDGSPSSIESIEVTPCANEPCVIKRGEKVMFTFKGKSPEDSNDLEMQLSAHLGDWVPITQESICGNGVECPVHQGKELTIEYDWSMDDALPQGSIDFKWSVLGDFMATEVVCVDMTLNVQ